MPYDYIAQRTGQTVHLASPKLVGVVARELETLRNAVPYGAVRRFTVAEACFREVDSLETKFQIAFRDHRESWDDLFANTGGMRELFWETDRFNTNILEMGGPNVRCWGYLAPVSFFAGGVYGLLSRDSNLSRAIAQPFIWAAMSIALLGGLDLAGGKVRQLIGSDRYLSAVDKFIKENSKP